MRYIKNFNGISWFFGQIASINREHGGTTVISKRKPEHTTTIRGTTMNFSTTLRPSSPTTPGSSLTYRVHAKSDGLHTWHRTRSQEESNNTILMYNRNIIEKHHRVLLFFSSNDFYVLSYLIEILINKLKNALNTTVNILWYLAM